MQKIVKSNPAIRFLGILPVLFGSFMIYNTYHSFSDEFFDGIRPIFFLFSGIMILFGIGFLSHRTEMIYDDLTIEKKTTVFGLNFSKRVDRALVRDIGPEAAGLISPYRGPRRDGF